MNTLKMKVVAYDEDTHSLLCSFASDDTASKNPSDYPAFSYQPVNMWPDVTDANEIMKRIAVSGIYHAELQAQREAFVADPSRADALKALVGREMAFSLSDLLPSPPDTTVIDQSVVL